MGDLPRAKTVSPGSVLTQRTNLTIAAIGLPPLSRSSSINAIQAVRRRRTDGPRITESKSIDRVAGVATSLFVLGDTAAARRDQRRPSISSQQQPQLSLNDMPFLSRQVTVGRNSLFKNLSERDREELGGIEYRSLKLLLKIVIGEFPLYWETERFLMRGL
jgi:hypothetical protein